MKTNKTSAPLYLTPTVEEVEDLIDNNPNKASLVDGKVPEEQLPSYVDDVLEFDSEDEFPEEGETGKIYVALDTNYTYRWSGHAYIQIGSGGVLVVANPELEGSEDALESIQIGNEKFRVEGGLGTVDDYIDYDNLESENPVQNKVIAQEFIDTWNTSSTTLSPDNVDSHSLGLEFIDEGESASWEIINDNLIGWIENTINNNNVAAPTYLSGMGAVQLYKEPKTIDSLMSWDIGLNYEDESAELWIYFTPNSITNNLGSHSPSINIVFDIETDELSGNKLLTNENIDMSSFYEVFGVKADENNNVTSIIAYGDEYHVGGVSGNKTYNYINKTRGEKIFLIENVDIWLTDGGYQETVPYEQLMANVEGWPYALNLSNLQYHTLLIPNPGDVDGISSIEIKPADEEYEGNYEIISYTVLGGANGDPYIVTAIANGDGGFGRIVSELDPQPINIKITYDNGEAPEME